jgi:Tfp pilus assembly protein PilV
MQSRPDRDFTPNEIRDILFPGMNIPITSIRRGLTKLTNVEHKLIKSERAVRDGEYPGRKVHTWRAIPKPQFSQTNLF